MAEPTKILLDESELPTHWYNVVADLPAPPPPPLHPATHEPIGPDDLAALFPMALIEQEVSAERYIETPQEVREVYELWRPSPLTLMKMHTLGHDFVPDPIHAGGLRYHGMSPLLSHVYELGMFEAEALPQSACFDAAVRFARTEGIVPAPEPTHALAAAIREAETCRETGEEKVILTALCGHGHFDMAAYDAWFAGDLTDHDYPEGKVREAMARVPQID